MFGSHKSLREMIHHYLFGRRHDERKRRRLRIEPLEVRKLLAAMIHTPYVQLVDAALDAATDQFEIIWQTDADPAPNESAEQAPNEFQVQYRLPGVTTD